MQIFEKYTKIPDTAQGGVVVIGNFDGVHKGHKAVLAQGKKLAQDLNAPFCVLTFEPHPRALFRPDEPPFRISPYALKCERLAACGVDAVFSLPFTWDLASFPADKFVEDVLIKGLKAAHVVVGYDFCFGQLRKGTPETIKAAGLSVTVVEEVFDHGVEKLSSSTIRQFLRHGKISEANALLGWEWEIRGTVVKGDQRGRELGYPTANVALNDTIHPAYGIYATLARLEGEEEWRPSATNIGIRPMFEIPTAQVETFIFDFDREIYGQTLHVRPVQRLRGEARFASLEELLAQMEKDCAAAREILK
ncbi:MAG: bifunctional riboflavin kinase/FAD synthetase [Alphaproteobacteria bacterium]|nr:bifunctional riboflavin kinase/FAD synthetase [Alphaproteobacteria bacterium]